MMDVCPICFATSHLSLLSQQPTGVRWNYTVSDLTVFVDFATTMDVSVQPLPAAFVIDVDGVPKTPDSVSWDTSTALLLEYDEAALAPIVVKAQLPVADPLLRSSGLFIVQPFDITGVEF